MAWSAVFDDPVPSSPSGMSFVPTLLPITAATITNAIHPKMAIALWFADQRPARAASPGRWLRSLMVGPLGWGDTTTATLPGACPRANRELPLGESAGREIGRAHV